MKNDKLWFKKVGGMIFLLGLAACAILPGQAAPPAPVIDQSMVETSIAGTVQAARTQTAAPQSLATETPTSMTGTTIEQAQDGTTKYNDYDGGFEIVFPVGWLAVRPNSEEFNASLAKEGAVNSMLHDQMTADLAGYEANFDRIYSYILRPDLEKNVILGFSKLTWDSEDAMSINDASMGELVQNIESSGSIPGFHADTVQLHEDGNIKMIEIGGRWMMNDGQGGTIPFYSTIIFFKPSSSSLVRITFTFLQDYQVQILTDVKSIIESIKITGP